MSKPGVIYRGSFLNTQFDYANEVGNEQTVTVSIFDNEQLIDDGDDELIIPMSFADNPVRVSVVDNDEDKFTPIRSKQAEIQVLTDENISIGTFSFGGDNRYYVEIDIEDTVFFSGWLSISDLRQTFQEDPNVLLLVVTDGLGFLKDLPLTDYNGDDFNGENKIIEYIAGCLKKTGLDLPIYVEMNIKEENFITDGQDHFYDTMYLNALTFEEDITEFEDCYTVLEKILGEDCYVAQQKNAWFIKRVDEFDVQDNKQALFDPDGTFDSYVTETRYEKEIGRNLDLRFMNEDAEIGLIRPYKEVRHTYDYETPQEIPCNVNFSRGAEISAPDLAAASSTGTYISECWSIRRRTGSITSASYIQREFEFGYEKERYLVITDSTGNATPWDFVQCEPIYVGEKDRVTVSVDYRWSADRSGGGVTYYPMMIYLRAENGDYYYWWHPSSSLVSDFYWTGPEATEQDRYIPDDFVADDVDLTEWRSFSVDLKDMPVTGKLYICLFQMNQTASGSDDVEAHYSNLTVDYRPFINGSYQQYTGQYNSVSQTGDLKAKRERSVFISDSPKRLFKGSLLKENGYNQIYSGSVAFNTSTIFVISGNVLYLFPVGKRLRIVGTANNLDTKVTASQYNLIGNTTAVTVTGGLTVATEAAVISELEFTFPDFFYNAAVYPDGPPDATYFHPFGYIQTFAVWNQFNRVMTFIEGTVDGLQTEQLDALNRLDCPDLMHTFYINDTTANTINRQFQLLHYEQDFHLCEWECYLVEVFNSDALKEYDDDYEFKYITND